MAPIIRTCSAIALIAAAPALASQPTRDALDHYVQARVLDAAGIGGEAAVSYSLALSGAPNEERVAARAYRQAVEAGDYKLAVRAAQALDAQQRLPGDGRLLLYIDTLGKGDWRGAGLQLDKMEEGGNFDFLAPILRGWLRFAAREPNPLEPLDTRARESLTAAYAREQRVYLLLALKQNAEGLTAAKALASADNRGVWLRLSAAARLAANKDRAAANDLLGGSDTVIVRARALLAAGGTLPGAIGSAGDATGVLLARVATDLLRDNNGPTALTLARLAAFAAPNHPQTRLVLAQALSAAGFQAPALAEIERMGPDGLFAATTREIRFTALQRAGRDKDALAFAEAEAARSDADLFDFARLGEALSRDKRHADASAAYDRAIKASGGADAPWNLWLLYGGALDSAGDWVRAKPALQRAVALAPDQPQALNHLGYAMLERKDDLNEATRLVAKAASLRPGDAAITDSLGYAFYLRGQTAESIAILERAVVTDPTEAALGEHLGDAYWAAGRKVEARYAWSAALIQAEGEDQAKRISAKLADGLP